MLRNTTSGGYTAFELDEAGEAKFLFQARFPYQRVIWLQTPNVQLGILVFSLLVFLAAAVIAARSLVRRKATGVNLAGLISALNLLFIGGLIIVMLPVATGGDKWQFSLEPSLALQAVLAIPLVSGLLAAILLVKSLLDWRRGRGIHLFNALVLVGMAAFLFFLQTWNLLGWRF